MGARPRILQLNGFTRMDRLKSVGLLRDAIDSGKGWITGFNEYSNISICIQFEIPAERLPEVAESLRAAEVTLNAKSEELLRALVAEGAAGSMDCTLQVLFVHNEPDLKRTVLAVPG
jgi:hypothetical protein